MAVWISYDENDEKMTLLNPKHGTYVSEEDFAKIPCGVKYLEYDKSDKKNLRKFYRRTKHIFGREEKDGKVTVFIDGVEKETLEMKREFEKLYFTEAL